MDRREMLKSGAILGAATVAAAESACATRPSVLGDPARPRIADMDEYLTRLNRDLEALARVDLSPALDPDGRLPKLPGLLAQNADLRRKGARTLYLAATFRDLSEEDRLHPGVQERMRQALPEMDEAVLGMANVLSAMTDDERSALQARIRRDPAVVEQACSVLEDELGKGEVPLERRRRVQAATRRLGWQIRHQSMSTVVDECVEKVRRVSAQAGTTGSCELTDQGATVPPLVAAEEDPPLPDGEKKPSQIQGESVVHVGAWMMGIGAAVGVTGVLLLVPGYFVGVYATTAGGVLIVLGLLVLIIGSIMAAL